MADGDARTLGYAIIDSSRRSTFVLARAYCSGNERGVCSGEGEARASRQQCSRSSFLLFLLISLQ